jgi:hypothetical protein
LRHSARRLRAAAVGARVRLAGSSAADEGVLLTDAAAFEASGFAVFLFGSHPRSPSMSRIPNARRIPGARRIPCG